MSVKGSRKTGGRKTIPWVPIRRLVQGLAFLGFLYSFSLIGRYGRLGGVPGALGDKLPLRLDPLVVLAQSAAGRAVQAGWLLAFITVVLTLLFGRAWCGWLCPLGTLLDWLPSRSLKKDPLVGDSWRGLKTILLGVILIGALFSNLTLLVLDPLTLMIRTLSTSVWPALDQAVTAAERLLFQIPVFQGPVAAFDSAARRFFLPSEPLQYRGAWLYGGLFVGVLALNAAAPRFWCRYLCPLGSFLGLMGKASLIKVQVNSRCTGCGICEEVCPTGAIQADAGGQCHHADCTMCMNCQQGCSQQAVQFSHGVKSPWQEPFDPGRREVLVSMGVSLAGVGLARLPLLADQVHPHQILPPGTQDGSFTSRCVRCGECVAACPTGGLQPSLLEAGWEGIWIPILVPRLGYCDYSCRACSLACPVQAIPVQTLDRKREQVLGKAFLNRERCIAWEEQRDCIVCEEMCPIPDKAIYLMTAELTDPQGNLIEVHQPHIDRDLCIGCGICEHQCPVEGEAAVRVFTPGHHPPPPYHRTQQDGLKKPERGE